MPLPVVIAKNQTGSPISLERLGLTVPASPGQLTLTDFSTYIECTQDEDLISSVASGDIIINDGSQDLTVDEGNVYLESSGNLDGPTSGAAQDTLLKLSDSSGTRTSVTGITVDASNNIDTAGGDINLNGGNLLGLRTLIHFIDSGPTVRYLSNAYFEVTGSPFPTQYIWWESSSKLKKIAELTVTRNANQTPATEVWKLYDTDGTTVLETVSDTINYSGVFEINRTRTSS